MMMCFAEYSPAPSAPFGAFSAASTMTLPFPAIFAAPQIRSTLFFFSRKPTPWLMLVGDAARALHHRRDVERHVLRGEAKILGVQHGVIDVGGAEQRLGRDAAPVRADAAEIGFFHDRGLQPELRGADGGDIAARPRADDDHVVGLGHGRSLGFFSCSWPAPLDSETAVSARHRRRRGGAMRDARTASGARTALSLQRLVEVGDDVLDVLQADREAHHVRAGAGLRSSPRRRAGCAWSRPGG